MVTKLEFIPNEIFLDLFDYFDGLDLFRTFYGLNFRFNILLHHHFPNYHFQFNSISKGDFDQICQEHLPLVAPRVKSLRLSDFGDTPGQINLFLSYTSSLNQFIHLRSLTVISSHSYSTLMRIITACACLCHLTHLNFFFCSFRDHQADLQLLINEIWKFPKLIHCHLSIDFPRQHNFPLPTHISSSIQSVHISSKMILTFNQIYRLFEYTSSLRRLSICIDSYVTEMHLSSLLPTLIDLSIYCLHLSDTSNLMILLQNTPNSQRLKVNLTSTLLDGYQWESIIRHYLPKLKVFQLQMKKRFQSPRMDELIQPFRSRFWLDEHQWFVRCLQQEQTLHIYTLSKATSNSYEEILFDSWRSTYPLDNQQGLYIDKTSIYNERFFEQTIPWYIRLSKIDTLWIRFPLNSRFWCRVLNLHHLHSLRISSYNDTFQYQLKSLLDRATSLRHLTVHQETSAPVPMSLFKSIHTSVRRLNLISYNHYFDEEECLLLTSSPLASQCEVLSLLTSHRRCIITLVTNMSTLRALHVRCADENRHQQLVLEETDDDTSDELVQWLRDRLASTCLIVRSPEFVNDISVWM